MLKFILLYLLGIALVIIHLLDFLLLPFNATWAVLMFVPWIFSGVFLWGTPKEKRIFFVNLAASVLIALAFYGLSVSLFDDSQEWKANLAGSQFILLLIFVWLVWGWGLLLFAGIKKFKS